MKMDVGSLKDALSDVDLTLERRLSFIGQMIAHETQAIRFYAEGLRRSREALAENMAMLETALAEVEVVASDPFAP